MGSWTAIDWVITGVLVPLVGMIIWVIKKISGYYFDRGGALDKANAAKERMFMAWESYMDSSKEIQAATAERLNQHDDTVVTQTSQACQHLLEIAGAQKEHGEHLRTLVDAGVTACEVAARVCDVFEIGPENNEAIESIKQKLQAKTPK